VPIPAFRTVTGLLTIPGLGLVAVPGLSSLAYLFTVPAFRSFACLFTIPAFHPLTGLVAITAFRTLTGLLTVTLFPAFKAFPGLFTLIFRQPFRPGVINIIFLFNCPAVVHIHITVIIPVTTVAPPAGTAAIPAVTATDTPTAPTGSAEPDPSVRAAESDPESPVAGVGIVPHTKTERGRTRTVITPVPWTVAIPGTV
jgi:hypothetical protein